jgi:hypothetical protein
MLGERAQRHVSRGSDDHKGILIDMNSMLHQSDTIFKRERNYSNAGRENNQMIRNTKKDQIYLHRGSIPKESSVRGRNPKGRYTFH